MARAEEGDLMTVAEYLTAKIKLCGKSQVEIAREVGFPRANVISMMKKSITPVPFARIPALAVTLGINKKEFMTKCLQEYKPDLFDALQDVYDISPSWPEDPEANGPVRAI